MYASFEISPYINAVTRDTTFVRKAERKSVSYLRRRIAADTELKHIEIATIK
jgi:hypothetical protein